MEPLVTAVNSGVADVTGDLIGIVVTNVPVILGLVAVTVGLPFGISLLKRFAH